MTQRQWLRAAGFLSGLDPRSSKSTAKRVSTGGSRPTSMALYTKLQTQTAPRQGQFLQRDIVLSRGTQALRTKQAIVSAAAKDESRWDRKRHSRKGKSYESKKRRRGRPEWMRSPDDTPLRDGTRDRVIGLLTQRAARTLAYYLSETNPNVYHWLTVFMKDHPIPRDGAWDDVSGESFLRLLLSMPIEHATYSTGRAAMYSCNPGCGVDPRNLAQRIMEIRTAIAKEMTQDLSDISEENSLLMRETIQQSFSLNLDNVTSHPMDSTDTV